MYENVLTDGKNIVCEWKLNEVQEECFVDPLIYHFGDGVLCGFKLLQYTGLKDKNQNEIYEGDVVQTNFILKGEIVFNEMASQWWINFKHDRNTYKELVPDFGDGQNYCQYIEVIGNVYSNPELLIQIEKSAK